MVSQSLIPSHVVSPGNVYPITVIGLYGVRVVGVEGGVARVLAHTDRPRPPALAGPVSVHTLTPRLALVGQLGQGGARVGEILAV